MLWACPIMHLCQYSLLGSSSFSSAQIARVHLSLCPKSVATTPINLYIGWLSSIRVSTGFSEPEHVLCIWGGWVEIKLCWTNSEHPTCSSSVTTFSLSPPPPFPSSFVYFFFPVSLSFVPWLSLVFVRLSAMRSLDSEHCPGMSLFLFWLNDLPTNQLSGYLDFFLFLTTVIY